MNYSADTLMLLCVVVTAEEDDLWCGLPPEQLALQTEQLIQLQEKLVSIRNHVEQLGDQRVIMVSNPQR